MSSEREFDLVIFGATGFTGFFVVRELCLSIAEKPDEYSNLKWAVAGRNDKKLSEVLAKVGAELSKDLSSVVKIEADVTDAKSLAAMASRTKLVINCVGPYRFYGRQVVEACLNEGTHHIDISGEPQYIESIQVEFNAKAKEKDILVVSTCGWDSIPCDLGVDFLKRKFNGKLHHVETFMATRPGPEGYVVNFGTLQSAIYGFAHSDELRTIRRRLYSEVLTKSLPRSRIRLERIKLPFTRPNLPGWNMEFPGSDRSVVQRTQYYNFQHFKERPVQIQTYFSVPSFPYVVGTVFMAMIFALLSLFDAGRRLLENYPEVLTFGVFSKKGPSRAQIDSTKFNLTIIGKGWSNEAGAEKDNSEGEPDGELDKTLTVLVTGRDPGYQATSTCIVQSGLTILKDRNLMPKGGVLTPASAFRDTKLMDRLQSRELTFQVKSDN